MAVANPIAEHPLPTGVPRLQHVVAGVDRTVLMHIMRHQINLAIWQRDVPAAIATWMSGSLPGDMAQLGDTTELPARCVADSLAATIPSRTSTQRAGISALAHDAGELAALLTKITGARCVRVRLECVTNQQCCYFHADRIPMRLLCTYRGRATEWLANDVAAQLGSPDDVPSLASINRLGTGDVAIMRGTLGDAAPLRHRSPPVDGPAAWRLLLAIDPV